jgi:hypothetical protein
LWQEFLEEPSTFNLDNAKVVDNLGLGWAELNDEDYHPTAKVLIQARRQAGKSL